MKRRIHQTVVGLSLLVLIPGALLSLLLLMGAIGTGIQKGFNGTDAIAIPLMIIPTFISWWGGSLFVRLYGVFSHKLWMGLLCYHGLNLCYCGMWLFSTANRDGSAFSMFSIQDRIIGFSLLVIPILTVMFTTANLEPNSPKAEPSR